MKPDEKDGKGGAGKAAAVVAGAGLGAWAGAGIGIAGWAQSVCFQDGGHVLGTVEPEQSLG